MTYNPNPQGQGMTAINEAELAELEGRLNRWGYSWMPRIHEHDSVLLLIAAYREQAAEIERLRAALIQARDSVSMWPLPNQRLLMEIDVALGREARA